MQRFFRRHSAMTVLLLMILFSPLARAQWVTLANPGGESSFAMTEYLDGKLYSFGGITSLGTFSQNRSLDLQTPGAKWQPIAGFPNGQPRFGGCAVAMNGKIYILGGSIATNFTAAGVMQQPVIEYDPTSNSWTTKASSPFGQALFAHSVVGNRIYLLGGYSNVSGSLVAIKSTSVYDVSTDTWATTTQIPNASGFQTASAIGSSIYLFGGTNGSSEFSNSYRGEAVDTGIVWEAISNMPKALHRLASGVLNNKIYLAGGISTGGIISTGVYEFDPTTGTYTTSFSLLNAVYNIPFMPSDGQHLYYIGGYQSTATLQFTPGISMPIFNMTSAELEIDLATGASGTKSFVIRNIGTLPLNVLQQSGTPTWCTVNKSQSTIEPGMSDTFTVTVTSAGMIEGDYVANILYATNDPYKSTAMKTVKMVLIDNFEPRHTLLEAFCSSTCPPCYNGGVILNRVLDSINDPSRYTVVNYPVDYPSVGDPYTTEETIARASFYQIDWVPRLRIDAGWNLNTQDFSKPIFESYSAIPSMMKIEATHTISGQTITVQVKITPYKDIAADSLRLMIGVCERRTTGNATSNGEKEFFHVLKKMLPDVNGYKLDSLTRKQPVTFTKTYTFPGKYRLPAGGNATNRINLKTENSVEGFSDLEAIVWVQNFRTKEVLNSAWSSNPTVGVTNASPITPSSLAVIFPNPTSGTAHLNYRLTAPAQVDISVFDHSGRNVRRLENRRLEAGYYATEFNVSDLPSGIYNVVLVVGPERIARTIIVAR